MQNRKFFNYWCYSIYERESVKVFENHSFTINLWTSNDIGHAFSLVISWWSNFDHVTFSRRQVLTSFFNEINSCLCFKSPFTPARISFFAKFEIYWVTSLSYVSVPTSSPVHLFVIRKKRKMSPGTLQTWLKFSQIEDIFFRMNLGNKCTPLIQVLTFYR